MPGFDGTGPRGEGPLTGRGEGYCAVQLPDSTVGQPAIGFAGLAGIAVRAHYPVASLMPVRRPLSGLHPRSWLGRRGQGAGRRRNRRLFLRRR